MVCSLGSGRMEALTRLLVAGNIQQTASEEAGRHKLAAQYIQRELREADEANLIDEEDMHMFGLRPLSDPLHLVCCNACKKPIKASQYVAHAELCQSLNSAEEIVLEVNDGTLPKKRPRKERKKSLTAYSNKPISVRKKAKLELIDNGFAASSCCSEEHHSTVSFPKDKRISSQLNVATVRNSSMVKPGPVDCSEGAILHQEEHSKMLIAGNRQLLADFGAANGVTKSWSANSREAIPFSGEEHQERSTAGSDNTGSHAVAVKTPTQVQKFCSKAEDVPHPLATKMYYSQRQLRLRSALSYMYHEASCNESGSEFACPKVFKNNVMPADISCHSNNSHIQINYQQEKYQDGTGVNIYNYRRPEHRPRLQKRPGTSSKASRNSVKSSGRFKDYSIKKDSLVWLIDKPGRFSVNSAYECYSNTSPQSGFGPWKMIWKVKVPYKVACFTWLVARQAVLTQDNLMKRGPHLCS